MLILKDGDLLFHGSYTAIREIDLSKCNAGLDFGKGFYLTTSYEQAVSFVPNSVKRNMRTGKIPADFDVNDGQISVFRFHENPSLLVKIFPSADIHWLHYIAANRSRDLFPEVYSELAEYDIVGGKIADDNTARVLNGYVTGLFGTPGDEAVDRYVIQSLLPNRLPNQFCFRTELAKNALESVRSDRYGDVR